MSDQTLMFEQKFGMFQKQVEDYLAERVFEQPLTGSIKTFDQALRYALVGGKRIRPVLVLATCEAMGGAASQALPTAAAVELFHAYSLVHDDLPAMDDDMIRRGQPAVHVRFGEATAILVGDALLTLGFEWIAMHQAQHSAPAQVLAVLAVLGRALGAGGMVGGQYLDLTQEFKNVAQLQTMQDLKTGALLLAACEVGALLGGGSTQMVEAASRFGLLLGQTYQLVDDLIDKEQDIKGNATMLDFLGEDALKTRADHLSAQACQLLEPLGERGMWLRSLAKNLIFRKT